MKAIYKLIFAFGSLTAAGLSQASYIYDFSFGAGGGYAATDFTITVPTLITGAYGSAEAYSWLSTSGSINGFVPTQVTPHSYDTQGNLTGLGGNTCTPTCTSVNGIDAFTIQSATPITGPGVYTYPGALTGERYLTNGTAVDSDFTLTITQVNPVPLPAAAWLMISGLGGIGAFARKKRASTNVVLAA